MRRAEPKILWLNLSGSFVTGLDRTCPITGVACLDDGLDLDLISARSDLCFLSEERRTRRRIVAHDESTDSIVTALRRDILDILSSDPRGPWLLACPRPSASFEDLAYETGHAALSPPADLCRWLNHKANFFSGRDSLGLPAPGGRWLTSASLPFSELQSSFGTPFVLQAPRANSGAGTAIVDSARGLARALARLRADELWCAPYLGRLSLNVNALATPTAILVSYPSVQLQGPLLQAIHRGRYCGNDFSATQTLDRTLLEQIDEQSHRLGSWLTSLGYRGLFGVDYVVDESSGEPVAVDLNPRWQGSTLLETMAARAAGRMPLAAADLLSGARLLSDDDLQSRTEAFRLPLSGSQLVVYGLNTEPHLIKRRVCAGIYSVDDFQTLRRSAVELRECRDDTEILLGAGVVRPETTLEPGARPARVFSRRACIDATAGIPHAWVPPVVNAMLRRFGLPADQPGPRS